MSDRLAEIKGSTYPEFAKLVEEFDWLIVEVEWLEAEKEHHLGLVPMAEAAGMERAAKKLEAMVEEEEALTPGRPDVVAYGINKLRQGAAAIRAEAK